MNDYLIKDSLVTLPADALVRQGYKCNRNTYVVNCHWEICSSLNATSGEQVYNKANKRVMCLSVASIVHYYLMLQVALR